MVVPEKPFAEIKLFINLLEVLCQLVLVGIPCHCGDTCRRAMCNNVVDFPFRHIGTPYFTSFSTILNLMNSGIAVFSASLNMSSS